MRSYAGIENTYTKKDKASIWIQPVIYDGTSTWGKGADRGFDAFLDASENMELYDIETDSEVYKKGVHILPELKGFDSPEKMYEKVYASAKNLVRSGKFITHFGGEHSISIGVIRAFYEEYPEISILQLDAHADLRKEYLGSKYNHACALHDASRNSHLIQVGIRSMDTSEIQFLNPDNCYFSREIHNNSKWMENCLSKMKERVYITLDLDVFDPSALPGTGTPEPGGLDWYTVTSFLKQVFDQREVVGFDIVELAPLPDNKVSEFLAAKLFYKMISYKFYGKDE